MTIKIGDKDYALRLRMLACRNYQKATGKNLWGDSSLTEIFGNGKDKDFNADLFVNFIYACICDAAHPKEVEITLDDVSLSDDLKKIDLPIALMKFYMGEKLGLTETQIVERLEESKKNKEASPAEAQMS